MAELIGQAWRAAQAEQLRAGLIRGFVLLSDVDDMTAELGAAYAEAAQQIVTIADADDGTFLDQMYAAAITAAETEEHLVQLGQQNLAAYERQHDV